ncbi:MAG: mannitol dehydrogenase family protein [Lachnospiraceae bacterium]
MKLTKQCLVEKEIWTGLGYQLPTYNREEVARKTIENPYWIHFGAGNIFRAFQARVVEELLNQEILDRGIVVAEGFDYDIIEKINAPHDDLGIVVTLKADGTMDKQIVGSVVASYALDSEREEFDILKNMFRNPSLQMATFTITEKGYSLVDGKGEFIPSVKVDMENGPKKPESYMGKVVSLLYERFLAGEKGIAMVSMDNCSHNGDKLSAAISEIAKKWQENQLVEGDFVGYVTNKNKVSFPWTMIDKITPRPDVLVEEVLAKDFGDELKPIITGKNTYVAPFVNAEECEYLVIEDDFPNGREALEKGGFIFAQRETVDKVEKMKVCTCLNPLHTALAVFGCLLGYDLISEEMKNPSLKHMVEQIGYKEGLPVVVHPGIMEPKNFIDDVVEKRLPNPFMPDSPWRIATDTSQKLAIRFGETIKAYHESEQLNTTDLTYIPLVFAGWLRYLMGINDQGVVFELSADPLLETLCPIMKNVTFGDNTKTEEIKEIISNDTVFGVDLYEVGLGEKVEEYFKKMNEGPGKIKEVLEQIML